MKNYDVENFARTTLLKVKKVLESESFDYVRARNASQFVGVIHRWANSLVQMDDIMKIIAPKKQLLKELEKATGVTTESKLGTLNLNKLKEYKVEQFIKQLEDINSAASEEYQTEKTLKTMKQDWEALEFICVRNEMINSYMVNNDALHNIDRTTRSHLDKSEKLKTAKLTESMVQEVADWQKFINKARCDIRAWRTAQSAWISVQDYIGEYNVEVEVQFPDIVDKLDDSRTSMRCLMDQVQKIGRDCRKVFEIVGLTDTLQKAS